ncbi:hypothetical protein BcDW1_3995 [Botrytis cinerea BcDW1]|uniref:Uncharacterized protein n=2 Tax=Botryotinia fuckeliana TaxID=40559 RepID=G2Y6G7_BOTF4|nr:hypothetical protein BcDW1_3995 [Botrytis cinerea BcDW1]CCD48219.1 hypothetical protein BofuT4P27000004001 [Botrytis cinerea T4]
MASASHASSIGFGGTTWNKNGSRSSNGPRFVAPMTTGLMAFVHGRERSPRILTMVTLVEPVEPAPSMNTYGPRTIRGKRHSREEVIVFT